MKKLLMASLALVASALLFNACKKADNTGNGATFSYSVNSTQKNATNVYAAKTTTGGINTLSITGNILSGTTVQSSIVMSVINFGGAASTYTVSDTNANFTLAYYNGTVLPHLATSGTLVISSVSSSNIQGTFSFVTDSFTVTNGTFNTGFTQ